ncbi:MAG: hypothetical protein WC222_11780 [Parachlamydiales bacterium]|jgi:hypothetical protein
MTNTSNNIGDSVLKLYISTIRYALSKLSWHNEITSYPRFNLIFKTYLLEDADGKKTMYTGTIFDPYVVKLTESLVKRVITPCVVVAGTFTILPLGLVLKAGHASVNYIGRQLLTLDTVRKLVSLWNDKDLYGDFFTSAPAKCYDFATHSFTWHLSPDNKTDRRTDVQMREADGALKYSQKAEYTLFPFELFEAMTRWVGGGTFTVLTTAASPLGLMSKVVHNLFIRRPLVGRID